MKIDFQGWVELQGSMVQLQQTQMTVNRNLLTELWEVGRL